MVVGSWDRNKFNDTVTDCVWPKTGEIAIERIMSHIDCFGKNISNSCLEGGRSYQQSSVTQYREH